MSMILSLLVSLFFGNAVAWRRGTLKMSSALPKVTVIGAGWGGWGAAKALCEGGCDVTLIDTLSDPAGTSPLLSPGGKPYEPGQRGFWYDYPNIAMLVKSLGKDENDVFTPYTNSSFYSPDGLEATAPVFSERKFFANSVPSPLGQVFASFSLFKRLPLQDRASIAGLLLAIIDMYRDEKTFAAYDRMSAYDLFTLCGVSKRLIDDFLRPTLLVGLFKPPEELSAAVTMELLYFYALAHVTSFDVRWVKKGGVSETFFLPLYHHLTENYNFTLIPSTKVTKMLLDSNNQRVVEVKCETRGVGEFSLNPEAVVLAVGTKGMKSIISGSPELAKASPLLSQASSLRGIDCISCRLWLDKNVSSRSPVNVFAKYPSLRGAGGTFFFIEKLQADDIDTLWGGLHQETRGSVVAVDFYNAGGLLPLGDKDLTDLILNDLLVKAEPNFKGAQVLDSHVSRYYEAVSWFAPGSYPNRPRTVVPDIDNLYCAGDWVVIEQKIDVQSGDCSFQDNEHGAKGLCQERAYVSGLVAGNRLMEKMKAGGKSDLKLAEVLPIRADEPQVVLGRKVNRKAMETFKKFTGFYPTFWLK